MGTDTNAITRKDVTIENILGVISKKYPNAYLYKTHSSDFFKIIFNDGECNRNMSVFFNDYAKNDYNIDGVLLSLGLWGNSVEIMKHILNEFGGYLDENDCDDNGFYPINEEKFLQSKELTELDKFTNEIIHHLGYENLNAALALFEKYKTLNEN